MEALLAHVDNGMRELSNLQNKLSIFCCISWISTNSFFSLEIDSKIGCMHQLGFLEVYNIALSHLNNKSPLCSGSNNS